MDKATPCNDLPSAYDQPHPYTLQPDYSNAGYMQPNSAQQPVYYPAPQGGLPGQQQQPTFILVQPTTVINQLCYEPIATDCSQCNSRVVTSVDYEIGSKAWTYCGLFALLAFFVPCLWLIGFCLIPFCVEGYKDAVHFCPNCHHTIARVPRV